MTRLLRVLDWIRPAPVVSAHCDGPCGVYDPASARVPAEAVLAMAKKLTDLAPESDGFWNTYSRFVAIKEQQADLVKTELNILWTDYFKPEHVEANPELPTIFWQAVKQASACKQSVDIDAAVELLVRIEAIHHLFWATKGREVPWILANP
ncbi:MAG: superoxide dismutase, Ni [Actinomycetia bacterium]|nr:superoxide dismutase, Ni [Actinomycetes bacterium]MCP4227309.1 superoxide dismutase, Ni [Actinomycetes bacterium]MCP5035280.1 superoxide dismutase, Ni [Actinomycetes bacterium]